MSVLLGTCAIVGAAACADSPTAVEPTGSGAALERSTARGGGGTVDVVCSTSYATPGQPHAYGYGRLTVKLSAASRAADGSTRQYRYRGYAEGLRVVLAANCTIPNTERAFRQMNQRFGVKEAHAGRGWNDRGGATTLMGDYTLPPLTVNACRYGGDYPECNPPPSTSGTETDNPPCWNDHGCDSGGSPTGGSVPEPNQPGDEEWQPDPGNLCDITAAQAGSSDTSGGCGAGPFMLTSVKLKGCATPVQGWAAPANSGGIQYYDLRRPGNIRSKSWGGMIRADVAYYEGTVILTNGTPVQARGEVWCTAGTGIFTY